MASQSSGRASAHDVGALVAGKYRVLRPLGAGGMGVVVEAEHVALQTRVALKFLSPEFARRGDVIERFVREARLCAQLRSEHVCRVSDVGQLDDGAPYFVMELLEGRDLANVLASNGPLPVATVADYIVQACDALAEAHAAQVVHRDVKPANLFLARRRDGGALIKVLDFGVAKIRTPRQDALTVTNMIVGSPAYMAPEQLSSAQSVDARSDLWSLGVILYELVTGRLPFPGDPVDIAYLIEHTQAPQLEQVPAGFARAVARCLEQAPERRFQRVADLIAALRPFTTRGGETPLRGPGGERTQLQTAERSTLRLTPQHMHSMFPRVLPLPAPPPSVAMIASSGPRAIPRAASPQLAHPRAPSRQLPFSRAPSPRPASQQPVPVPAISLTRFALPDWHTYLPLSWRTPRRTLLAGSIGTIVLCLLVGMLLAVSLSMCTHARGAPTVPTADPPAGR